MIIASIIKPLFTAALNRYIFPQNRLNGGTPARLSIKSAITVAKNGDIFIIVGYEADIKEFEKLVGVGNEN